MSYSFMSLPRELRQRILLSTLPLIIQPAISTCLLLATRNLLQISRTIRQDMYWVLNNYSPLFYFRSPSDLAHDISLSIDHLDFSPSA